MKPHDLMRKLREANSVDRVWYDVQVLREWSSGMNRFYLLEDCGGSRNNDSQYFICKDVTTQIDAIQFYKKDVEIKSVETEKQNFEIGFVDGKPVIMSADPEHFWK